MASSPSANNVAPKSEDGTIIKNRLYIANIPFVYRGDDLKKIFQNFGEVLSADIVCNERGSKGFGFVTMGSAEACDRAQLALHRRIMGGRVVEVMPAKAAHCGFKATRKTPASTIVPTTSAIDNQSLLFSSLAQYAALLPQIFSAHPFTQAAVQFPNINMMAALTNLSNPTPQAHLELLLENQRMKQCLNMFMQLAGQTKHSILAPAGVNSLGGFGVQFQDQQPAPPLPSQSIRIPQPVPPPFDCSSHDSNYASSFDPLANPDSSFSSSVFGASHNQLHVHSRKRSAPLPPDSVSAKNRRI